MQKMNFDIAEYADVYKVLGDKTRLSILKILEAGECCVCVFAEIFDISQPAISQHLKRLKDMGIVAEDPRKQWVFYSLAEEGKYYGIVKAALAQIPDDSFDLAAISEKMGQLTCC